MQYFVQHVAGTGDLARLAIKGFLGDMDIRYVDDSAMIFDSHANPARVAALPFVKNAFVVLVSTQRRDINGGVRKLAQLVANQRIPRLQPQRRTFRIMAHIDGSLASIDPKAKTELERAIGRRTGARVEPRGMCQEYWVVGRQDLGELLLCARLPRDKSPATARGAISYELSSMLVFASRPTPEDVFLDPFAGSGAFVLARSETPASRLWYSDLRLDAHRASFPRRLTEMENVSFRADYALTLPSFADGEVDVIVTDPPWGEYEDVGMPYPQFCKAVAKSFERVLRPATGRFVVLSSRSNAESFHRALKASALRVDERYDLLVNGHPATAFVGHRSPT